MSYSSLGNGYKSPVGNLTSNLGGASTGGFFGRFGSNKYVSGTRDFLQSNTLVAKVVFLVLVVIAFIYVLRLGAGLIAWFFSPSPSPYLVKGIKDAKKFVIIPQDPKDSKSITLLRSNNQRDGLEFTYSVWIFIDDLTYTQALGTAGHIFHKGSEKYDDKGIASPNNGPGLYLDKDKNALIVKMNTFPCAPGTPDSSCIGGNVMEEQVMVNDIPLNKWVNVILRVDGMKLDVYVNGTIAVRHQFKNVPKQNYGKVFVNMNRGFSGMISSLRYFNRALSATEIMDIVRGGPNMEMDDSMNIFPPYFSLRWYFQNASDKQ